MYLISCLVTKGRQWGNYNTIIDHTPHEYIILKCFPYFQCIYVTVLQTKCSFYTTATAVTIIIIELKDLIFTLNKIPCRLRCLWNVIITNDHYIASRVHCRYLLLGFTVIVNGNMTPFWIVIIFLCLESCINLLPNAQN